MRIDDIKTIAGLSCLGTAIVGGLGAYIIKPIFHSMSPVGVALTCGVTTAIGVGVLMSDMDIGGKFVGLMASYPAGLLMANLLRCNVRFLDPMVATVIGGGFLTPMVLTAFLFAMVFRN